MSNNDKSSYRAHQVAPSQQQVSSRSRSSRSISSSSSSSSSSRVLEEGEEGEEKALQSKCNEYANQRKNLSNNNESSALFAGSGSARANNANQAERHQEKQFLLYSSLSLNKSANMSKRHADQLIVSSSQATTVNGSSDQHYQYSMTNCRRSCFCSSFCYCYSSVTDSCYDLIINSNDEHNNNNNTNILKSQNYLNSNNQQGSSTHHNQHHNDYHNRHHYHYQHHHDHLKPMIFSSNKAENTFPVTIAIALSLLACLISLGQCAPMTTTPTIVKSHQEAHMLNNKVHMYHNNVERFTTKSPTSLIFSRQLATTQTGNNNNNNNNKNYHQAQNHDINRLTELIQAARLLVDAEQKLRPIDSSDSTENEHDDEHDETILFVLEQQQATGNTGAKPARESLGRLVKRSGISDQRLAEIQMIRALKKQLERAAKLTVNPSLNDGQDGSNNGSEQQTST